MNAISPNGFIGAARAEGGGDTAALERAFASFSGEAKATAEKVGKLTESVDAIETDIDKLNRTLASLRTHGADGQAGNVRAAVSALGEFAKSGKPDALRSINASMTVDSDPDGGYTVPPEIGTTIIATQRDFSPMRRLATVRMVNSDSYEQLVSTGGGTASWVGERQSRPETDSANLRAVNFPMHELYANPSVSQKLLDDSAFDIGMFVEGEIAQEFELKEGAAWITGDGVNKPRGLLSYGTEAAGDASRAFGTIEYVPSGVAAALSDASHNGGDVLIDMVYSLKAGYRRNAHWLMNSTTVATVRKLKSTGDTENYLWRDSIAEGQPPTLIGYPVEFDENMPDIGANEFPIAFGDFSRGYLIADRTEIRLLRDPYTNKPYVMFYTTKRVGGGLLDSNAIKLLKIAAS